MKTPVPSRFGSNAQKSHVSHVSSSASKWRRTSPVIVTPTNNRRRIRSLPLPSSGMTLTTSLTMPLHQHQEDDTSSTSSSSSFGNSSIDTMATPAALNMIGSNVGILDRSHKEETRNQFSLGVSPSPMGLLALSRSPNSSLLPSHEQEERRQQLPLEAPLTQVVQHPQTPTSQPQQPPRLPGVTLLQKEQQLEQLNFLDQLLEEALTHLASSPSSM